MVKPAFVLLLLLAAPAVARPQFGPWQQYASPEEAGFSSAALAGVRQTADSLRSGAVMVVHRGRVLAAWGDVARELEAHSVRKSLVSALYGIAVGEGRISLEATLAQLGIDDTTRLTAREKQARVRDLIAARSGVYLPAAYAGGDQDTQRPARGAHAPGTAWFYNNWDFNIAGVIYEQQTGERLYDSFRERIARPLGMEDYAGDEGLIVYEPMASLHPAHTFRVSARDLARFGQLYLQRGQWDGREVVPAAWVAESTSPTSDLGNGRGYGYMWWTYAAGSFGANYPRLDSLGAFAASGTGGQAVIVVPGAELVFVHRGDTDHDRGVSGARVWAMLEQVLAARLGQPAAEPRLMPLSPEPLASQLPPLERPAYVVPPAVELSAILGEYSFGEARGAVSLFRGRPFMFVPGEGQAELFATGAWEYYVPVAHARVRFERDPAGAVSAAVLTLGSQVLRAPRAAAQRNGSQ